MLKKRSTAEPAEDTTTYSTTEPAETTTTDSSAEHLHQAYQYKHSNSNYYFSLAIKDLVLDLANATTTTTDTTTAARPIPTDAPSYHDNDNILYQHQRHELKQHAVQLRTVLLIEQNVEEYTTSATVASVHVLYYDDIRLA